MYEQMTACGTPSTVTAPFSRELAGFEAVLVFAGLSAASKHDETPKKDVQNFGKGVGDASKVSAGCEVSAGCAHWDMAETCGNRGMGTGVLPFSCPHQAGRCRQSARLGQ